jgi:hypothetical protein
MLHPCFVFDTKFSDCICKCCIVVLYLIRSSQIVYVNVTSLFWICTLKFSDCLCKCYILVLDLFCEFSNCLGKCYILVLYVHYEVLRFCCVNVTSLFCICIVQFSDCLCKCYIVVLYLIRSSQIVYVNVTSLCLDEHCEVLIFFCINVTSLLWICIVNSQIVYVNVPSLFCMYTMKFSDCLCKCYIIVLDLHCEILKLFI